MIPPDGVAKDDFIKERIKIRSSIKDEEVLETETSSATMLLSTNRLADGGLVTISTDVTDLKKNNQALERLLSAMQKVPNGMMLWDKDDSLVFANDFVQNMQSQRGSRPFEVGNSWVELQRSLIDDGVTLVPSGKSKEEFLSLIHI